jgi:hypothetical protein
MLMYPRINKLEKQMNIRVDDIAKRVIKLNPSSIEELLTRWEEIKSSFPDAKFALSWDPPLQRFVLYVRFKTYSNNVLVYLREVRQQLKLANVYITTDFAYND